MYGLCLAHIWPMYDLHMAHIAFRSAISSAIRSAPRTDHQGILAGKKVIRLLIMIVDDPFLALLGFLLVFSSAP